MLHLGVERPLLGAALGLAVAATIGILVGFELADVDNYGGGTIWIGTWVGSVLAVVLVLAGLARLRALPREPPDPRWLDALFVAGGGLAFASTFMPWAVAAHHLGGPGADAWWVAGSLRPPSASPRSRSSEPRRSASQDCGRSFRRRSSSPG